MLQQHSTNMKKIWHEESGTVLDVTVDFNSVVRYKVGMLYWEIIKDNDTGQLLNGWVEESQFDGFFGRQGIKRSEFTEITNEDIIAFIAQKKISTVRYLTDGNK